MYVSGTTFANFAGPATCNNGSYAIANHRLAPDAFHPHFFSGIKQLNVSDEVGPCSNQRLRLLLHSTLA
jgi:hypothetical protein